VGVVEDDAFDAAGWGGVVGDDGVAVLVGGGPVDAVGAAAQFVQADVFGPVVSSTQASEVSDAGVVAVAPVVEVVDVAALRRAGAAGGSAGVVAGLPAVGATHKCRFSSVLDQGGR
jgi:hypothetical protein